MAYLKFRKIIFTFFTLISLCFSANVSATVVELITNGNFETGTFSGWTVTNQANGSGDWFIDTPGTTTPSSGNTTQGNPSGGSFYAVTDQGGPGTHVLTQNFTVAPSTTSAILSFDMFMNDLDSGPIFGREGLDYTGSNNQFGTVDILQNGSSVFSMSPADIVANLVLGVDAGADPNPYTNYLFDITSFVGAGGTYQLRFAEVDNQNFFNMGVDNVSITASNVPEPSVIVLMGLGLLGFVATTRRRIKK